MYVVVKNLEINKISRSYDVFADNGKYGQRSNVRQGKWWVLYLFRLN